MCGDPYNICLLIWVAKLETSHVLQSNKNKSYRGHSDRLSVSIGGATRFSIVQTNGFQYNNKISSLKNAIGSFFVNDPEGPFTQSIITNLIYVASWEIGHPS